MYCPRMSEQLDALKAKLAASDGRPGYEQRTKALQEEIARVEAEEAGGEDGPAD